MPITVTFTKPITDRWAAQQSITVTTPANVAGRFEWRDDKTVQFVPDQYWPAHSEITMMAGGIPRTFGTGSIVLGVADISAHTFTVSIDGQVARQMPASMGKPRHPTPVGSFTALEKQSTVVMDSRTIGIPLSDPEGYKLTVNDAVRVTWGGGGCTCTPRRGRSVRRLRQCQPRLHQPEPGQRLVVFQPGSHRGGPDRHQRLTAAGLSASIAWRFLAVGEAGTVAGSGG